jgi:hypothetical protein
MVNKSNINKSRVRKSRVKKNQSRVRKSRVKKNKSRVKKNQSRARNSKRETKFYGITDRDFGYIKLDEHVSSFRTFGENKKQNNIRKNLNAILRTNRSLEEPVILAKQFAALEELYRTKKVNEKDYNDIKDDMYNEFLPSDFDTFEKSANPNEDPMLKEINTILSIEPVPNPNAKEDDLIFTTLLDQIVSEADNNRGLLSSDKPRGPKVRKAEQAKRGIADVANKVADVVSVVYDKTGNVLNSVGGFVSAAVDSGVKGIDIATKAAELSGHAVDAAGHYVDAAGKVVDITGNVGDLVGKVADLSGKGINLAGNVVDVAGNVVDTAGTAVKIVGDGVSIVNSTAQVVGAGTSVIATGAGKLASAAVQALNG